MRLIVVRIVVLLTLIVLAGCGSANQPAPTPTPTRTPLPDVTEPDVTQPSAPEETEIPPAPPDAEATPTDEPVAEAPVPEAPDTTDPIWATLPAQPPVECDAAGDFLRCYDTLLELNFESPQFMGPVTGTELRESWQAGYFYEYAFADHLPIAGAGGRSADFAEGRGAWFTDQLGFGGASAEEYCAQQADGGMCHVVNEQVVVMTLMPQAFQFCQEWMMTTVTPQVIVAVDLPDHPLIHGFGFTAPLLPPEMDEAWTAAPQAPDFCAPDGQATYDAQIEALRQDLPAGTADAEIQARYDAMVHLAESIEGPYVGAGE